MATELERELQEAVGSAYRLKGELARGGMSHVFLADDLTNNRQVVIKLLDPELATAVSRERFRREIRVAASLQHRHVVPVIDSGESGDRIFYFMPYVVGESLRSRLVRERQLPVEEAISLVCDVASALAYASRHNIVHRDIKPDNILIDESGRAVVTDFGIARAIERSADLVSVTSTGFTLGTPTYMSPEQAGGEATIDGRSDIYSLGCVLYEMLAGEPPFTGPTARVVIARHMQEAPRDVRVVRPAISSALEASIKRALAKSPADRFRDATEFDKALKRPEILHGPRADWLTRTHRRVALAATGLVAIAVVVFAAQMYREQRTHRPSPTPANPSRVAVLEFEDQSAGRTLGHIASGLSVSLVHELSSVAALHMVSRNGLRTLRDRNIPLDSIVRLLRVGSVVEGSVRESNGVLRVTVQLVDAASSTPLASVTVERRIGELFRLEDDVTREVATLLRRRIGAEVRVRATIAGTRSARARDLSFRANNERDLARALSDSPDEGERARAIATLVTADSLLALAELADPGWLSAVIDRGWVVLDLAQRQSGEARLLTFARAIALADRVLATHPDDARALELRANARYWKAARLSLSDSAFAELLRDATTDLERAVAADSLRATAWGTLSLVEVATGDLASAERHARVALARDSYLDDSQAIQLALLGAYLIGGSYAEAGTWCRRGRADFPREARFIQCELTLMAEDPTRQPDVPLATSLRVLADSLDPPERAADLGREYLPMYRRMMYATILARAGSEDSARAIAYHLKGQAERDVGLSLDLTYEMAFLHLVLGQRTDALGELNGYVAARPSLRGLVARHARWRPLHADPRFREIVSPPTRTSSSRSRGPG